MEAGLDAGGEHITPYSKFVDRTKVSNGWKAHPASPSTVTSVAILPLGQTKKNLKTFLRERLFPPNHDVRSVLFKSLAKRIVCNESLFSQQMYTDFLTENCPHTASYSNLPLPSYIDEDDDMPSYWLNDHGKLEMRRILLCINHHFSFISYCPILPPIVALFLHYDDLPSQVFANVCHVLFCTTRHAQYVDQNRAQVDASTCVLKELVNRFAPSSHKTLVSLANNPDAVYCQWLKVLFHGLPFPYLVIAFDMYLLEGYKALVRTAIAILKFYRKVGQSNPTDIISAVFNFVRCIETKVSVNLLFKKAYSLKLPSAKEIKKLHLRQLTTIRRQPYTVTREITPHKRQPWRYITMARNASSDVISEALFCQLYCWIPERYSFSKPLLLFSTNKDGYSLDAFYRAASERNPSMLLVRTTEGEVFGAFLTSDWSERKSGNIGYFGTGETFLFTLCPEQAMYPWVGTNERFQNGVKPHGSESTLTDSGLPRPHVQNSPNRPVVAKSSRGIVLPPIRPDASPPVLSPCRDSNISLPPLVGSPIALGSRASSSSIPESTTSDRIRLKTVAEHKTSKDLFMYADENGIVVGGGNGYGLFIDPTFLHCSSDRCDTFANEPLVQQKSTLTGNTFQCSVVELFGFSEFAL